MQDFTRPWKPAAPDFTGLPPAALIRASSRLAAERFPALLLFSLIVAVFMFLPKAALIGGNSPPPRLFSYLSTVSLLLASGAAAASALFAPGGERASAVQCLLAAAGGITRLLRLGFVVFFVHAVLLILVLGIGMGLWMGRPDHVMLAVPLADVALAAFLASQFSLAAPVCILEGKGAFPSLSRSFSLLRGCRLSVFPFYLVLLASNVSASLIALKMLEAGESPTNAFAVEAASSLILIFLTLAVTGTLYRLRLSP
jgi:hypothetical protein